MKTKVTLLLLPWRRNFLQQQRQQQFQKSYGVGNGENGYAIEQTPMADAVAGHNIFIHHCIPGGMTQAHLPLWRIPPGRTSTTLPPTTGFVSGIRTSDGGHAQTAHRFRLNSTSVYHKTKVPAEASSGRRHTEEGNDGNKRSDETE